MIRRADYILGRNCFGFFNSLLEEYSLFRTIWVEYRIELGLLYFAVVVLAGLVFEDLGSRIEVYQFDRSREAVDPDHMKNWHRWLQLKTESARYGSTYIEAVVGRFKFELNMVPACVASLVGGVFLLSRCPPYTGELLIGLILLVILAAYLYVEAESGHKLLADIRKLMLAAETEVSPRRAEPGSQNNS